ncbi:MAG: glycoside hydrolase family 5 protein [Fibromonadales bacterium]|nr:glycoside hydrolase family 5 protein [Fibromonadales bacterium]
MDILKERLRGLNIGGWFSQVDCIEEKDPVGFPGFYEHAKSFITQKDLQFIKDLGFNHVRLPVDYFNFFKGENLELDNAAFEIMDKAVDQILDSGLALILDLHKCPGHDFHQGTLRNAQPLFADSKAKDDAKKVWSVLAERYGGKKNILLEILNEPVAPDSETWNKVKDELFWHIRKIAPKAPIVVGSNKWNNPAKFADLTPLDDDNVLYSFHSYQPVIFTHQHANWIPEPYFKQDRSWPGTYAPPEKKDFAVTLPIEDGAWSKTRLYSTMENALEFRSKYKVPVACNEFGVYVQVERASQLNWIRDFTFLLKEADVGFSYWNYKNLDFGLLSVGENLHKDLPQYNNAERFDRELAELLARA